MLTHSLEWVKIFSDPTYTIRAVAWKTRSNDLLKCQNCEKRFEHKCTTKFLFCPPHVNHNLDWKNQMERKMSSHCDKNSAHNVGDKYKWISLKCS